MPPAATGFQCLKCGQANGAERRQCTHCRTPRPFAAGAAAAARGPSPRRGVGRGPGSSQAGNGQPRAASQQPAPWQCFACSFADNFVRRRDCYQCGVKKPTGAPNGERRRRRGGQHGRDASPAPVADLSSLIRKEAARLQGSAGVATVPANGGTTPAATLTPAAAQPAASPQPDEAAIAARARLKEIATALQQIGGCTDPQVGAARAKLEMESQELALKLRSSLPLRAQLKSAMAQCKSGLAACAAIAAEIQELELVLEDRRRALGELRLSTVSHQQQVDTLTA